MISSLAAAALVFAATAPTASAGTPNPFKLLHPVSTLIDGVLKTGTKVTKTVISVPFKVVKSASKSVGN